MFWAATHVSPTEIQISLRILAVWSVSSLSAWINFVAFAIEIMPNEGSDSLLDTHIQGTFHYENTPIQINRKFHFKKLKFLR